MKKIFIFLLIILVSGTACMAQTRSSSVKIYAYSQVTTPGTVPVDIDEKGNPIERKIEPRPNYHIYVVCLPAIKVTTLYIKGVQYSLQQEKVLQNPVIEDRPDMPEKGAHKILVPKTSRLVYKITPVIESKDKQQPSKTIQLAAKNEVVLVYNLNGKKYYSTAKKIIVLEPIAAM